MESLKLAPRVASRPYRKDRSTTIAWRWLLAMALGFTISAAYASTLVRGFAGTSPDDFGTQALAAGDDNSSGPISLTSVFPGGINYFGQVYSSFYVNNNGNITFKGQEGAFTPVQFPSSTEPMIAPFWADVDTRGIALPHLNLVFYAFDATSIYVTWDYVGYYNHGVDKLDAFQIVLTNRSDVGPGDFDVEFIYEQLQWDSGGASNGIPAQIGFDAGDGINYVKQKDSFTDNVLTVTGTSNIGIPGVWKWEVRNGAVGEPPFLIQISQPAPSATIEAGANVSFAASTTNDVSIAVMDFYVDQTKIGSNSGSPASVAIPPNDLPVGQHTLRVVAQNETGQSEAVSESVTVVDTTGPTVDNVTYAGTPFSSNSTITDNGILAAHISDFSGISTVVVMIDGTSTFGGVLTNGQFTSPINFDQIPNGQHTLTITAIDNANNSTIVTYPLTLAIPPPPRPSINTPSGGTIETNPIVQVTGGSVPQSQVQMYVNGVASGSPIVAQSDEVFATSVVLPSEGTFTLTADATTLHGTSSLSSPVTISYDISGPKIQNVQYGGSAFVDGSTLTTVASLTAQISDQSAVASINVTLDGNPLSGGALVNQSYSIPLGLDQITNGSHTVGISAVDIVGNASSVSISFTLAIPPPQAPTILAPQNGTKTNQASPTVSGSSVAGSQVQLYLDDVATGSLIAASASNTFSGSVTIGGEGTHQISSDARNTRGTSARSAAVQVIYDTTPPSIQNVTFQGVAFASGATVTSAGTLAAQATDANGIASVSATIDGTAVAGGVLAGPQFTIALSFAQVANGSHTLVLTATDTASNAASTSIDFVLAMPPPTAPVIKVPADGAIVGQASVTVSGTSDLGTQVQLFVDGNATGVPIATTGTGTFSGAAALGTQATHQITAMATNSRGSSSPSAPITVIYDLPPAVVITTPASGASLSSDTNVAATVTSGNAIAAVDFYADATKFATVSAPPYQATWSIASVGAGSHTLKAVATDSFGQAGQASVGVTVISTDRPTIQNVTFQGSPLSDGATLTSGGALVAQITDSLAISSVKLAIDGANVNGGSLSGTQFSESLTFSQFANGSHTLTLTSTNSAGNSTQFAISFTLAIGPPAIPVIKAPTNGAVVTQPTVSVSGTTDVGTQVQLFLDGGAIGSPLNATASGTFSGSVVLPTQATHQINAVASNSRGTSAQSASVTITYTPPPPSIVITSPSKNATLTADTDVSVAIIDTADITQVEFDIDGSAVATLTATPYTWRWVLSSANSGSHTIAVKATDSAGRLLQASIPDTVQITPPPPPPIVTPYTGDLQSISPGVSYGEQPITINGSSVDRTLPVPNAVPNALLTLVLQVNGFKRQISVTTDGTGAFSYVFHPYSTDAGSYVVSIIHPQETTLPPLGFFTINRLNVNPGTYALQAARTVPTVVPVTIKASSGSGSSGVYLSADPAAQPSGNLPAGITVTAPSPVNIAAGGTAKVNVQFSADSSGGNTGTVVLVAHASDSGTASRGTVAINYTLSQPMPALFPQPTSVQAGVSQGNQVLSSVKLQNKGLIAATNVIAQVLNSDGTTNVPGWVNLASGAVAVSLDVGATETIQLNAAPTTSVTNGIYKFKIRITADNASGGDIPVSLSVTNSGVGNVVFNAADIYTDTLDGGGNVIPGLAGATIKVQNQFVYTVVQSATTDASGNAKIDNLPVGSYTFVANAPNHSSASGVLTIQPGATTAQSVFLDYNVVSIQWSVTETDIPDEYQVTLNATYQTQVPAPVVVIEPTSVNLPNLQVGEVFTGEMTITNYGLVRADDVVFTPPANDASFTYEFMGQVPTSLQAKQRISLPYKITAVAALPAGASANLIKTAQKATSAAPATSAMLTIGGGILRANATAGATCNTYSKPTNLTFDFSCANGTQTKGSAAAVFARVYGQCTTSGGSGGGGNGTGNDANGFGGPDYGCPSGQQIGDSPGCTPICISCLMQNGGASGDGNGPFGGGPMGPTSGGGNPPPIFGGPVLQ